MNFSTVLEVIGSILGIIGLLAIGLGYARVSLFKAQIEALRGDRDDLSDRVKRLEVERDAAHSENNALKEKVAVLEKVVTGRDAIAALEAKIEALSDIRANQSKQILDLLNAIHSNMGGKQ